MPNPYFRAYDSVPPLAGWLAVFPWAGQGVCETLSWTYRHIRSVGRRPTDRPTGPLTARSAYVLLLWMVACSSPLLS